MKKILIRVAIVAVVLLVAAVVAITLSIDSAIKHGVEKVGPMITKVDVTLDKVSLSLLSGSGSIDGFVLGNPEGYSTPSSIEVGHASLAVQPSSLLSDKVVVRHVRLESPVITFEGGLSGNNLNTILDNVTSSSSGDEPESEDPQDAADEEGKKLQVDEFVLSGATVHVNIKELGGQTKTLTLPDIKLTDLGTGPEGITSKELTQLVLAKVVQGTLKAVVESGGDLEKIGEAALKQLDESGNADTATAVKGVIDLFQKKAE